MPLHTTSFERVIHLLLFFAAAIAAAVGGLAILERLGAADRKPFIRNAWIVAASIVLVVLFALERMYHLTHHV